MPDVRVQDEQGIVHVFPDGSTPEMIAKVMNVKPPSANLGKLQTLDPNQPGMQPAVNGMAPRDVSDKAAETLDSMWQGIRNGAYAIPNMLNALHDGTPSHEIEKRGVIKGSLELIKKGFEQLNPVAPDRGQGPLNRTAESAGQIMGAAATPTPEDFAGISQAAVDRVKGAIPEVQTLKNAPTIAKEAIFPGPQSKTMPSGEMPALAKAGTEDIFRAAAPTSMNKGFRENLNVAAPDLADIARKVDVAESKGGIVNPDMRVRATVNAIRDHLGEMYSTERAPQIERNAEKIMNIGANPNAIRGLEFLQSTAGDVAESQLAQKAIDSGKLTVAEADQLAQLANKTLRAYEKMTPEGKMQLQATSPKIGGIKSLDTELGVRLNDILTRNGESGLMSYERRFAALSAVRDQLESRMNASELKQEGMFGFAGRVTRPLVKMVTEGPSGVPSASQAATADVNIGRSIQSGMSKLKASGISAKRTPQ